MFSLEKRLKFLILFFIKKLIAPRQKVSGDQMSNKGNQRKNFDLTGERINFLPILNDETS